MRSKKIPMVTKMDLWAGTGNRLRYVLAILMVPALTTALRAADISDLMRWVPGDSNALVIVDAESLFESPLARRGNWRQKYADQYAASPLLLPPEAEQFVMAAELDFSVMVPQWEVAAMTVARDWSTESLAKSLGGELDAVGGLPAVRSPFDAYVLRFDSQQFAVYSPANRQAASRWARQSQQRKVATLPPYLDRIANTSSPHAGSIRLAIDTRDVFPQTEIRKVLANSKALRGTSIDLDAAAGVLAQLEGVTLLVTVTDEIQGTLEVDFGGDVSPLRTVAKSLLLEQLWNLGAMLEDLNSWDAKVGTQSVQLTGPLSEAGLRRFFSLFAMGRSPSMPVQVGQPVAAVPEQEPTGRQSNPDYSRRYFQAIASYVAELQRSAQTASPYQFMMWVDSYADRIEQLPWAAVDADLQSYAKRVAQQLRQMLAALNGLNQQSMVQQSQIIPNRTVTTGMMPTWRTYNYGGYRARRYAPFAYQSVDVGGALQQQQQIQRETVGEAEKMARRILDQIVEETEAMQTKMSQRYQIEF